MEIISLERYASRVSFSDVDNKNKVWGAYRNGQGEITLELPNFVERKLFKSGVICEYLVE